MKSTTKTLKKCLAESDVRMLRNVGEAEGGGGGGGAPADDGGQDQVVTIIVINIIIIVIIIVIIVVVEKYDATPMQSFPLL